MRINAEFDRPALSRADERAWVASPAGGVERQMLDRVGDEVARATSIVRYAPSSSFPPHEHDLGEEFLVLDGTFADEHGAFPAGSYVRNPPGTAHEPRIGADGCTIFVKLRQFDPADLKPVAMDVSDETAWAEIGGGIAVLPLHGHAAEDVFAVRLDAGAELTRDLPGGAEMLILEGTVTAAGTGMPQSDLLTLGPRDWLRLPPGARLAITGGPSDARLYLKTGHLPPED